MISIPRTLAAISQRIRGDMRREMPGTDATVWPNNLSIFSKVFAAALHEVDLRGAWLYRQIFASTATAQHLERQAYEFGMARKAASRATGSITLTGTPATIYPAGVAFLSGGDLYRTTTDTLSAGDGAITVPVISELTGASRNRTEGDAMTLADVALYPTLSPEATIATGGIGGGADKEGDESLRARILDRKRRPPQGGAVSDYEQITRAIPGVTKAWAYSFANGPGSVGVWFLFEGRTNGIPTAADVEAIQTRIDLKRMIRADLHVNAPIPAAIDVTIEGLMPDRDSVRAAIRASLEATFNERSRPGVASDPFTFSRSWIGEAISIAAGETAHRLTAPAVDVTYSDGRMPVLGNITYV